MARQLPPPELSVNLLREIADSIERECIAADGEGSAGNSPKVSEAETVAKKVARSIEGDGFRDRLAQRRARVDDDHSQGEQYRPRRARKGPGKR